jgi:hypothetical protein
MKCGIDRAPRDLSGTIIGFVGTGVEANRFEKYSNPDLRYLTCFGPANSRRIEIKERSSTDIIRYAYDRLR